MSKKKSKHAKFGHWLFETDWGAWEWKGSGPAMIDNDTLLDFAKHVVSQQVGPGPQVLVQEEAGLHKDEGKSQVDGIDPAFVLAVGDILQYGAQKYAKYNWTKGIHFTRIYASAMRHLLHWYAGEDIDPESGLPHLHHAACNIHFLISYTAHQKYDGFDDRPFKNQEDK